MDFCWECWSWLLWFARRKVFRLLWAGSSTGHLNRDSKYLKWVIPWCISRVESLIIPLYRIDSSDASFELRATHLWMEQASIISFITSCIDIPMEDSFKWQAGEVLFCTKERKYWKSACSLESYFNARPNLDICWQINCYDKLL